MDKLTAVGFTRKPHGLKGEIKLHIEERYLEDVMKTDVVMLQIKGKPTPFFVDDIRVGNAIIGKFEDIDTPESALYIANKEIFLREQDMLTEDEREYEVEIDGGMKYVQCIGHILFDGEQQIGEILDILEFPQQEMAVVEYEGREILIPLNDAFVKNRDDEAKTILMDLLHRLCF